MPALSLARPALPMPAFLAAMKPRERHLTLALGASFLAHALLLTVHFTYPDALVRAKEQALDVVLVNAKHKNRPDQAQVKAQANLDGGGNTDQDRRAATPLPPSQQTKEGNDLVAAQQRVAELEARQRQMLSQLKSDKKIRSQDRQEDHLPPQPQVSGFDLANRAMAIARLEAQIDRQLDDASKRPRIKHITSMRAMEYLPAQYIEDWRQKVERVGNLNYPEAARGRLYGSLVVYIEINAEGELVRAEVQRSSGQKVLDEAALRILRLAAPYGKFSSQMREQFDVLAFARTWSFTQADRLQAQ
ncbi:TonB family protein [Denitratisoma sp. agr-D3]